MLQSVQPTGYSTGSITPGSIVQMPPGSIVPVQVNESIVLVKTVPVPSLVQTQLFHLHQPL